jgi:hypothetical protein
LIGEALNKARQEAARQEAARQRLPYAVGAIEPPRRRGSLGPLLAGILVGCLAVGGLFGVAYLAGWGPWNEKDKAPDSPPVVAEAAPAPVPALPVDASPVPAAPAPPPSVAPEPLAQREPVPEIPEPQPRITITPEPAPAPAMAPPVEAQPQEPVPQPAPGPVTPAPQPPPAPAAPAPQEAKSYVGEVPVPGGGVLRLSGIAFSEASPVVVLDGRVMGPGESAQGFTVMEIQSNRVRLEGHGETVYVSLK